MADAGQKSPLRPKRPAREVSRTAALARPSDMPAARQFCVNTVVRSPPAARSTEPELEP